MTPKWLRGIGWISVGLAFGLAFVVGVRYFASPLRFVPTEGPWVFVSPGCPFSVDVYRQIREADEGSALRAIMVVPADDGPSGRCGRGALLGHARLLSRRTGSEEEGGTPPGATAPAPTARSAGIMSRAARGTMSR